MTRSCALAVLAIASCAPAPPSFDAGPTPELGRYFVGQRNCASCHDDGHGTLAGSATPVPGTATYGSNLTPDPATGLGDWADVEILRAIRSGVDEDLQLLCPSMPHLGDMGDLEARSIIAYLRSLPAVARPDLPASRCPPIKPPMPGFFPPGD